MKPQSYRPDIDGLRALAVLLVVGYHASPTRIPGGFIGVDVFFVISGYLITGIILREIDRERFSLLDFYARRCRRIAPALVVVLVAVWAIGWRTLVAAEFDELGQDLAAGATFTTNFTLWHQAGYFATEAGAKPLLHLWSLAVEEQFYLIWPLLLFWITTRRLPLTAIVAVLGGLSFAINIAGIAHHAVPTFYLLPSRFWELMIGAALACLALGKAAGNPRWLQAAMAVDVPRRSYNAIGAGAVAVICLAGFMFNRDDPYPGWLALVPTLAAAALIVAGDRAWVNRVPLSNGAAVFVGLISYPLYLWHWPLLSIAHITDGPGEPRLLRMAIVGVSVLLAWLTWRFIERPVRERLPAHAGRARTVRFVAATVGALAIVASGGWMTHEQHGLADRYPALERRLTELSLSEHLRRRGMFEKCAGALAEGNTLAWCETSRPGEPVMALLGDSHADSLFPGLAAAASDNWLLLAQPACPPTSDIVVRRQGWPDVCADANGVALRLMRESRQIRTIVLALRGLYYDHDRDVVLAPAPHQAAMTRGNLLEYGLAHEIDALQGAGHQVILFLDVPELDFLPADCVETRPFHFTSKAVRAPCAVDRAAVVESQRPYRAIVGDLAAKYPRLRVFDPLPLLCDARQCDVARDGVMLYRDRNHLSLSGSRLVAGGFLKWLEAPSAS